jgi:hypothetical protein
MGKLLRQVPPYFEGDAISTGARSGAVIKLLAKTSAGIGENTAVV